MCETKKMLNCTIWNIANVHKPFFSSLAYSEKHNQLLAHFTTSVCLSDTTVLRFNSPAEPARTVGRTDGQTDFLRQNRPGQTGLCIISTNARWSVCLWRGLCRGQGRVLKIVTRLVVDQSGYQGWYSWLSYISVVLKRVLEKNQISTSNCLEPGSSLKFFHPPELGALFDFANFQIPGI